MAKKKPTRVKQRHLPGTEPPSIPEIDGAAEIYFDRMQERKTLLASEVEAKDALIDLMKDNRLTRYVTPDDLVVEVTAQSNVKCKKKKAAAEDNDADA